MPSYIIDDIKGKDTGFSGFVGMGIPCGLPRFFCEYGMGMRVQCTATLTVLPFSENVVYAACKFIMSKHDFKFIVLQ